MYPNLYFFLKEVFGIDLCGFRLINSFGFFVALSFIAAAVVLGRELKRREGLGYLTYQEAYIMVGKGPNWSEIGWNAFFGFILGYKILGVFFADCAELGNPQEYLLSKRGNVLLGIICAAGLAAWLWYKGNKVKLDKPEKRTIRIWPHDRVGDMTIFAAVFGFLGAKIFHNLENWGDLVKDPIGQLTSFSGLTFYGGLICAGAAIIWYARKHKINIWHLCDSFGPALMIAYAIGRIGCQVSGDGDWGVLNSAYVAGENGKAILADSATFNRAVASDIGFYKEAFRTTEGVSTVAQPADVPRAHFKAPSWMPTWAVAYTYPHNVIGEGIAIAGCEGDYCKRLPQPVFPAPFYETLMGLVLFGVLMGLRKRLKTAGMLFGVYLVVNGLERFLIEKIRVNTTYDFGIYHPTQAELISFALIIAGIIIFFWRKKKAVPPTANA